jgi:hypothetical protein
LDSGLLIQLSNGLGIALELTTDGEELRDIWFDEVQALWLAKNALASRGLPLPEPAANVLAAAYRAGWKEELDD